MTHGQRRRVGVLVVGWPLVLTAVLLWPMHRSGYLLGRDMVFTPRQPLTRASAGAGAGSPRAVPLDALVALGSRIIDGALLGRVLVGLVLPLAAWGMLRLLGPRSLPALLLAGGLAVWNPFVVERLALGQWALLYAYAALPWIAVSARSVRADERRTVGWAALFASVALASITPTGALIGAAAAVVLVAGTWLRSSAVLILAGLAQLAWVLPAVLGSASSVSDPAAVAVFAARSERAGGVLLSLLGLGGIWDRTATPDSRAGLLGYLGTGLVVLALAAFLWWRRTLSPASDRTEWPRLAALAAAGFVFAAVSSVPGGGGVVRWAVEHVPGAGLWRDSQKWLIPLVMVAVLGAALLVDQAVAALRGRSVGSVVVMLAVALFVPVALLPDAAASMRPTITPVHYPQGWAAARDVIAAGPSGTVLSLPFASYRRFPWVSAVNVIDPLPRWLSQPVLVDDRLVVDGRRLAGEDPQAALLAAVLASRGSDPVGLATALADHGVRWVWVERDGGGADATSAVDLSGLTMRYQDNSVALYQVPAPAKGGPGHTATPDRTLRGNRLTVLIAVDALVAGALVLSLGVIAVAAARRCYTRR
ncbi:hypothetical protein M6D93_12575 [Jatrophihabitans telluris]|uniref:YfhO family protein n=1 Tax=Jatrophihabitans telluris TaxID=2038343 RepID=A0ABY4QV09_9ACTN|nr:hypothetical protein [Jatrophihabitans telluris]UQX87133.1 hypothetical protein M6D93_12575 [Jatrophihabitans telluris]